MFSRLAYSISVVSIPLLTISCKTLHHSASLKEESLPLQWDEKSEIFDFSTICPLRKLQWKPGGDPVQYISEVIEGSTPFDNTKAGKDSGVVVSVDGANRQFFEKYFPSCGAKNGGILLRYSVDRIPGNEYAYEMFVKDLDTNEVIGLAFNSQGKELNTVPPELAFDKDGNKKRELAESVGDSSFSEDNIVRRRLGCFSCHPTVSSDYDVRGHDSFWKDAKPVEFLQTELAFKQMRKNQDEERARHKRLQDELNQRIDKAFRDAQSQSSAGNGNSSNDRHAPKVIPETTVIKDITDYVSNDNGNDYHFYAAKSGYYRIETYESSPSITALLKLKENGRIVAENHHGGARLLNARIDRHLYSGQYTANVSHFLKSSGQFKLRIIYSETGKFD